MSHGVSTSSGNETGPRHKVVLGQVHDDGAGGRYIANSLTSNAVTAMTSQIYADRG
ncbi:hypothetical protein AB0K92_15305 [Streptomyces sp. NPDC052687]|uniref:hypothetical protein n=1 Tax=Streptomyces sp. NPDC052687 TaxID=3154759 RepID=UPI00343FD8C8